MFENKMQRKTPEARKDEIRYRQPGKILHNEKLYCEISGSHGSKYEDIVCWDAEKCSLEDTERRFKGAYRLNHQSE
jgi:hypothetical protein